MNTDDNGNKTFTTDELLELHNRPEYPRIISWLATLGIHPKADDTDEMTVIRALCDIQRILADLEGSNPIWYNEDAFGQRVRTDLDRTRDSLRRAVCELVELREWQESNERCSVHQNDQSMTGHCTSRNCWTYAKENNLPYEGPTT